MFISPSMVVTVLALALLTRLSFADEGGASVYLPGSYGSMAAVPGEPGWSVATIYLHSTGTLGDASARSDQGYSALTYTFATPVLAGQLSLSMVGAGGLSWGSFGTSDDSRWGFDDLAPGAALRWNAGVHNYLLYAQGNIPVGTYDSSRLANFGLGHWGIDSGAGYTYFDANAGYEFSAVAGLTYNFENPDTLYRNGIDAHIDWGVSKFVSERLQVGFVGYYYQQLTSDSGQPPGFGAFKGRVAAFGPQIGYLFPIGDSQGYVNLKAYREFAADNRLAGWNSWLTISISPKSP